MTEVKYGWWKTQAKIIIPAGLKRSSSFRFLVGSSPPWIRDEAAYFFSFLRLLKIKQNVKKRPKGDDKKPMDPVVIHLLGAVKITAMVGVVFHPD